MKIGNLEFSPIIENKNLVPKCIYDFVSNWNNDDKKSFSSALINWERQVFAKLLVNFYK